MQPTPRGAPTLRAASGVPASVMAAMDGRDLEALRRAAKADAEAAQQQREVKTDPNIYYALTIIGRPRSRGLRKGRPASLLRPAESG